MLTFLQFLNEAARKPFIPTFPDKLSELRTSEEVAKAKRGVQSLSRDRGYNWIARKFGSGNLAAPSRKGGTGYSSAAIGILFDPDEPSLAHDKPALVYHGARHMVQFDPNNITLIHQPTSTTPSLDKAISHSKRDRMGDIEREEHHVLAIHYDPKTHAHAPLVNIAHHSAYGKEDELLFPPGQQYELISSEPHGLHPETGKKIVVHHVEPSTSHHAFDPTFNKNNKEEFTRRIDARGGRDSSPIFDKNVKKMNKKMKKKGKL